MGAEAELLALRLGLIGIILAFVLVVAMSMRSGVRVAAVAPARPAERRTARFVVVFPGDTGLAPGTELPVAGVMSIGRDPGNGIVLSDASVSTRHASIERTREGWRLSDLGSTNGTTVRGRPVEDDGARLVGGEQIAFGNVIVRFQL